MKTRTLQELARCAIDIQDACNLHGLVREWAAVLDELRPHLGAYHMNTHPINILFANKMASLTGSSHEEFAGALRWCRTVSTGGKDAQA